jgi:predicted glycosyltransferase
VAIAKRLRACGHDVVLTTRRHPDTTPLAKLLGENFDVVGKYDPTSPLSRLRESAKRQLLFCKMFESNPPDIAISHRSVELCRVAFGLGVHVISTHDTPHAEAVNRLTMPLIDVLVVSKSIPKHRVQGYGIGTIEQFDGVDEVAWIKGFKPKKKCNFGKPLIVVRHQETKAAYALGETDLTETLARKLSSLGEVVFLSRYDRRPKKDLIVPKGFVDSASLVAQADLVVGVGGTIQREAALQGTPSIVIPIARRIYVNDYLSKKGFPIFTVAPSKAIHYARKLLGKKQNVKDLLAKLENPLDVIQNILRRRAFND